jgi:hypothetical protein
MLEMPLKYKMTNKDTSNFLSIRMDMRWYKKNGTLKLTKTNRKPTYFCYLIKTSHLIKTLKLLNKKCSYQTYSHDLKCNVLHKPKETIVINNVVNSNIYKNKMVIVAVQKNLNSIKNWKNQLYWTVNSSQL